jgi:hypothetical protein
MTDQSISSDELPATELGETQEAGDLARAVGQQRLH